MSLKFVSRATWVQMDRLILLLKKRVLLGTVGLTALSFWLLFCWQHYRSYWGTTIFRVQTVDFNLLHHTLPTTLSELIIGGRDDLIQEVLDSNYGIFGLVVTDAGGNSILYKTNRLYHQESWQPLISPEFLEHDSEPYDLLTDPPPIEPRWRHESPRAARAVEVNEAPNSRILGRIYYVRQPPPSFAQDIGNFLNPGQSFGDMSKVFSLGWFELSGSKRGYLLITLVTIGFSLTVVLIVLFRQRGLEIKRRELELEAKELDIRQKALDNLTSELTAQKARMEWLENEADLTYRRALSLKEALSNLKDALNALDAAPEQPAAIKLRPPIHPPSALLTEIEALIPGLSDDAQSLRAQADQLKEHCQKLERQQEEMRRVLNQVQAQAATSKLAAVLRGQAYPRT